MRDVVAQRLQELYAKHGVLTPSLVLQDARRKTSPLHSEFEWDDAKAADKHRLHHARGLIRQVTYLHRTETRTLELPAYTRDPDAEPTEQGYKPIAEVATQKDLARRVLHRELQRIARATERMETMAAVFGMEAELEALRERVDTIGVIVGTAEDRVGMQ